MATGTTRLELLLRRDRTVLLGGLTAIALLAWAYLVYLSRTMGGMGDMRMSHAMTAPLVQTWGRVELLLLFGMWTAMMVAMMVPSATPLVLMFARANRRNSNRRVVGSAGIFLLGYLLVWAGYSGLAALVQWRLHNASLLSPAMTSTSSLLSGALLIAAGGFQFTPLKRTCLLHCRSPLAFVTTEWRSGRWGSFVMGLRHGLYCVGCCWALMTLLFVAGIMNLLWVAAIAAFVLLEKAAPRGDQLGRITGAVLVGLGIVLILG